MILYEEQTGAIVTDAEIVSSWLREGGAGDAATGKTAGKLPSNFVMGLYCTWPNPPRPRYVVYCSGCDQEMLMYDCDLILGELSAANSDKEDEMIQGTER